MQHALSVAERPTAEDAQSRPIGSRADPLVGADDPPGLGRRYAKRLKTRRAQRLPRVALGSLEGRACVVGGYLRHGCSKRSDATCCRVRRPGRPPHRRCHGPSIRAAGGTLPPFGRASLRACSPEIQPVMRPRRAVTAISKPAGETGRRSPGCRAAGRWQAWHRARPRLRSRAPMLVLWSDRRPTSILVMHRVNVALRAVSPPQGADGAGIPAAVAREPQ